MQLSCFNRQINVGVSEHWPLSMMLIVSYCFKGECSDIRRDRKGNRGQRWHTRREICPGGQCSRPSETKILDSLNPPHSLSTSNNLSLVGCRSVPQISPPRHAVVEKISRIYLDSAEARIRSSHNEDITMVPPHRRILGCSALGLIRLGGLVGY